MHYEANIKLVVCVLNVNSKKLRVCDKQIYYKIKEALL